MATSHDEDAPVGVAGPISPEGRWDTVGDKVSRLGLPDCRRPIGAERIRGAPCTGRIDHRARQNSRFAPVGTTDSERKRGGIPAGRLHLVVAGPGDARHSRVEAQVRRDFGESRQGRKIVRDELRPSGQHVGIRLDPAAGPKQLRGDRVDVVTPRRKDLHVTPCGHVCGDRRARLEHDRPLTASHQVRRGRQADRTGSDDRDRIGPSLHARWPAASRHCALLTPVSRRSMHQWYSRRVRSSWLQLPSGLQLRLRGLSPLRSPWATRSSRSTKC